MKTVLAVVGLLFVSVMVFAGEETKEPKALTELRQQYQKELVAAVKPVKEKYLKDLKGIQDGLTKMGMLEEALAVKAEVKALEEELASDKPVTTKSKYDPLGRWTWNTTTVEITPTEVIHNADHFKWKKLNEKTFKVYWGAAGEHTFTLAPDGNTVNIVRMSDGAKFTGTRLK